MSPKRNFQHNPEQGKDERKSRQDHRTVEPEPAQVDEQMSDQDSAAQDSFLQVQHLLGNRAVERLVQKGSRSGEFSFRPGGGPPAILRQVLLDRAAGEAGLAPAVQREGEEAETDVMNEPAEELETPAAQADSGTVTIQPVNPTTYDVTGANLDEVGQALGTDEWGRCTWNVTYTFETTGTRVTKVDVTLSLTINMPRWTGDGYANASPAARAEWQRMTTALQGHEDHHAAIARTWAPRFKQNMLGQTTAGMRSQYTSTLAAMETEESNYDSTSNHGQNEGVSLDTSIP